MPSVLEQNAVYLQSGNPLMEDTPTLHAPGTLGARFTVQHPVSRATPLVPPKTKKFQLVRVVPSVTVVPGGPAYWVDRAAYTVTPVGGTLLNQVAGIFNNAATAGNYTCIQIGGPGMVRASDANVAAAVAGADNIVGGATNLGVLTASGTAPATASLGTVSLPKVTDVTGGTGNHRISVDLNPPENA